MTVKSMVKHLETQMNVAAFESQITANYPDFRFWLESFLVVNNLREPHMVLMCIMGAASFISKAPKNARSDILKHMHEMLDDFVLSVGDEDDVTS